MARGSEVQSHTEVGSQSRGSFGYMRSYLKKEKKNKNKFTKRNETEKYGQKDRFFFTTGKLYVVKGVSCPTADRM